MLGRRLDPIHPGEILAEEFVQPLGISISRLARDLHVPPNRIHGIVHGSRAITADTALRLGTHFGTAPETWMNLQSEYDLRMARRTAGEEIGKTVRKREAVSGLSRRPVKLTGGRVARLKAPRF